MSYSTKVLSTLSSRELLKMYTLSYITEKKKPAYGREIWNDIKSKTAIWTPSHGSLYPTLDDMVKDKILSIELEEGKRKYYKITQKGKRYYKDTSKKFVDSLRQTSEFYSTIADELVIPKSSKSQADIEDNKSTVEADTVVEAESCE